MIERQINMKNLIAVLFGCFSILVCCSNASAQLATSSGKLPAECRKFETPLGIDIGRALGVMKSADWRLRSKIVRCISFMSQADELLRSAAKDTDPRVRRTVVFALGEKLITSPLYVQLLSDSDPLVRSLASRYAYLSGTLAVDGLVQIASDRKALLEQRILAIEGLAKLGQEALPARAALSALTSNKEVSIRIAAIKAIGAIGSKADDMLPALERRLSKVSSASLEAGWLRESIVRLDPRRLDTSSL